MTNDAYICLLSPEQIEGAPRRTIIMGYVFGDDVMSQHKLIEKVEGSIVIIPSKRFIAKVGMATEGAQLEDIIKEGNIFMKPEYWTEMNARSR